MSVITTTIRMEDSQFFARLNQMEARLGALTGNFAAIATRMATAFAPVAGGVLGVTGAVLGLKKAVDEAANMEQLLTSFTVLTGSAQVATETLKGLQKFADETTFQMPEVAGAAKQLIAFGVGAGEVTGTLRMLGDVAAGLNIPLSELTDVYGRNLVQGRLFSRDIYQFQGRGIPIVAALAKQFGVAESELMGLVEAGQVGSKDMVAAFQDMTKEGGLFAGMLAKQAKTFNGLMSTLADAINAVFRKFGGPLITELKPLVEGLIERVKEMAPAAREFGEQVARAVRGLYEAFQSGKLSEAVGVALELGFMKAMNALSAGMQRGLLTAGTAFSVLVGSPDFWSGALKALLGVAAQFGAALLDAFRVPLAYVQAFMEKAMDIESQNEKDLAREAAIKRLRETDSRFMGRSDEDLRIQTRHVGIAHGQTINRSVQVSAGDYVFRQAIEEAVAHLNTVEERANRILAEGGPRYGFSGEAKTTKEIANDAQDYLSEGVKKVVPLVAAIGQAVEGAMKDFKPSSIYSQEDMAAKQSRYNELYPARPVSGDKGGSASAHVGKSPGDILGGGRFDVVADSLAKIGGGGGVAGVNMALEEARAQTKLLTDSVAVQKEIKEGIIQVSRYNAAGKLEITTYE